MKRATIGRRRTACGFTLVELLLVMGIIVMLVGLLFPAVNAAVMAVRAAATESAVHNIEAGLEAFKTDWTLYPPSKVGKDGWLQNPGDGYYALMYYLTGPEGKGWGSLSQTTTQTKVGPFGGTATGAYGPYYKATESGSGAIAAVQPIQDAFKPAKYIFYYRFEPLEQRAFDYRDNNASNADATIGNFLSDMCFEFLVKPYDPVSRTARWVRQDYLLISAGADRYWGYVKELQGSGTGGATITQSVQAAEVSNGTAMCDDICNFKH